MGLSTDAAGLMSAWINAQEANRQMHLSLGMAARANGSLRVYGRSNQKDRLRMLENGYNFRFLSAQTRIQVVRRPLHLFACTAGFNSHSRRWRFEVNRRRRRQDRSQWACFASFDLRVEAKGDLRQFLSRTGPIEVPFG